MSVLDKRRRDDPRRETTVAAFVQAARSLLDEGASFADLNVSRIAERAGRTRTAFYAYFDDRRDLLFALLDGAGDDAMTSRDVLRRRRAAGARLCLTTSTRGLLDAFRRHATIARAVIEAAGYDEAVASYWDTLVERIIRGSEQRLRAEGLNNADARATATALVWMTERVCYQQAVRGATDIDDDQAVAALSRIWWNTLSAARAGAR